MCYNHRLLELYSNGVGGVNISEGIDCFVPVAPVLLRNCFRRGSKMFNNTPTVRFVFFRNLYLLIIAVVMFVCFDCYRFSLIV